MSQNAQLELLQTHLDRTFRDLIIMDDYGGKPSDGAFHSRALAAFVLSTLAGATPAEAALGVVDGLYDNGIDALHYDAAQRKLYCVQTKWRSGRISYIDRGDCQKFLQGVSDLVAARFDRFNDRVKFKARQIERALTHPETRIELILAHTGESDLGSEARRDFADFLRRMNDPDPVVQYRVLKLVDLYQLLLGTQGTSSIDLEVTLHHWMARTEPYTAYLGEVDATAVAGWYEAHHERLFVRNIRMFLGGTYVNRGMTQTLRYEPEHFWYFNNGITALCRSIQRLPLGGGSHDVVRLRCHDLSIVNGAQTVGSIAYNLLQNPAGVERARVLLRLISLENAPPDFAASVTRTNNTQNRIDQRDFVVFDPNQERLRRELRIMGVDYVYRSGDRVAQGRDGFDFLEAIAALACAHPEPDYAVMLKSRISALWDDLGGPPYTNLFHDQLEAQQLWPLVQLWRRINDGLRADERSRTGDERLYAMHGNRLLAHLAFQRLNLPRGRGANIKIPIQDRIDRLTTKLTDALIQGGRALYPDVFVPNVFKSRERCRTLAAYVNGRWNGER